MMPPEDKRLVLDALGSRWEELRGRRVFLTGGTGFFGTWLLQSLAWANEEFGLRAEAVVLSRNWDAFRRKAPRLAANPAFSCHAGDVRDFEFPAGEFSHVIHAATQPDDPWSPARPLAIADIAVRGTWRVLEFARHCKAEKFLLTSSGAVYGKQPPEMTHMPEDYCGPLDAMDPRQAHANARRMAEHLCALFAAEGRLAPKIARGFTFVGPGLPLDSHYAVGNFIRDGLGGGPIAVNGDAAPYRSYLYAADLAVWLWSILFVGRPCRPYNVGSEAAITIAELARTVAACFPGRVEVQVKRSSVPGRPAERYVPSTRRAAEELGLVARVPLSDAIERTIRYHRELAAAR